MAVLLGSNWRGKTMKILAIILAVLGLTGCVMTQIAPGLFPWHYYALNGIEITANQAALIVPLRTTKGEVFEQLNFGGLNKPAWARPDGQAVAYTWEEVREPAGWRNSSLHMPVGRAKGEVLSDFSDSWSEARAFCIAFDSVDRVTRCGFLAAPNAAALEELWIKWSWGNVSG